MPPISNEKQEKFLGINEKHPKVYEIHREVFFIYNAKHLAMLVQALNNKDAKQAVFDLMTRTPKAE